MIKRICDCCGEEVRKDFVEFYITWNMADAVSGKSSKEKPVSTPCAEYCVKCFNDLLGKLRIERIGTIKE